MPATRRRLAILCLVAAVAQPAMADGLGDAIAAMERRMSVMPEAQAAGPEATARYVAGLVAASLDHCRRTRPHCRIKAEDLHGDGQIGSSGASRQTARTSFTSGTKWRSRFSMPCFSVAVEEGQPAQDPFMFR